MKSGPLLRCSSHVATKQCILIADIDIGICPGVPGLQHGWQEVEDFVVEKAPT